MARIKFLSRNSASTERETVLCCRVKNIITGTWLFVSLLVLSSCEKVIQLNLPTSASRVVIQGNIYDEPGPYLISVTSSVNFDETSDYPPVTGATVTISDNAGQTEVLSEPAPGFYYSSKLQGIADRSYSLSVKTREKVFEAVAKMPPPVDIDSIYFSKSPYTGYKIPTIKFNDPPGMKNYYRVVYFINDTRQEEFYVLNDDIFQGLTIKYSLIPRESEIKLVEGDKVTVWLESVDFGVYQYFLTAASEGGQTSTPSNPVSNISNGALGYFNACTVRRISATVGK